MTGTGATSQAAAGADALRRASNLVPFIREHAAAIEAERRLPDAVVDALVEAGLFHLVIPPELGGVESDPVMASRVVEEISYADGAAGWCVMIAHQNAGFAGFLPAEQALTIWGDNGIVAGTARPIGRAVATSTPAEGYVVSGRWPFASGSSHATWFAAECVVHDGEEPRKDAQGEHVTRMLFVPRAEVTVHDTWYTSGLRGTASHDFSIDGAFVPHARGFQVIVDEPLHPSPLYRAPMLVFMNHGSQALGVARAALETARQVASEKAGWGGVPLKEQPRIQAVLAEATALVESARTYLYATAEELWAAVQAGGETPLQRSRLRLAASNAATASVRGVDLVHAAMGATSIFSASPLERQFRDIHTAAAHVMIGPLTYEAAGRVELGLDAAFPFF